MDINYELYKVFACVAKHRNFTTAAEEMFVSQSAISQSIKALENKLDTPLFYRNKKNISLTAEGALLYGCIEQGVNYFKTGERILIERKQIGSGEIRIASTDTICKYFLLSRIKEFRLSHPNIKFNIVNMTSQKCLALLKNGDVDMAVTNLPAKHADIYRIEKYIEFQDAFFVSREVWANRRLPTTLEELYNHPIIVLDKGSTTREFFDLLFTTAKISIVPQFELSSLDLLLEMTKAGLGVGFAPTFCINEAKWAEKLNIKQKIPLRRLGISTLKSLPLSPLVQNFINMMELKL